MERFGIAEERILLEGIGTVVDDRWGTVNRWCRILIKRDTVLVSMCPPAIKRKQLFRMREIVLSEVPLEKLPRLGRIIGFEMAAYLHKYRRYFDLSASVE